MGVFGLLFDQPHTETFRVLNLLKIIQKPIFAGTHRLTFHYSLPSGERGIVPERLWYLLAQVSHNRFAAQGSPVNVTHVV